MHGLTESEEPTDPTSNGESESPSLGLAVLKGEGQSADLQVGDEGSNLTKVFPDKEQAQNGTEVEGDGDEVEAEAEDDDSENLDEEEWEEYYVCPLNVRFTQEKIHPFFYRRGPILNVLPKIRAVSGAEDVLELVPPFAPIHCLRKDDELWSLDNRRLYALQNAAIQWWPVQCCTRVLVSDRLPRRKRKTQIRKFHTQSEGRTVHICARYKQFDTWNWFDNAVELEWCHLSDRIGALLSVFEIVPVLGGLLYRTGLTGLSSRVPLLISFLLTCAMDFTRQKLPVFERRICELHVKAIMDGNARRCVCGRNERQLMSAPQIAAIMSVALVLLLPYVFGIEMDRFRSSLLSCWLGLACVFTVQLVMFLLNTRAVHEEFSGVGQKLSPKHR
uniref:Uncharacterized protein n=1 Tax=Noctiluca scintillans TaxID=2966 RepID=A0A7S1F3Y3_NOCSC|mmetsp:Transcript_32356/g.86751  ORF Transcript_32356/g.86751 Transcript_32356/m.86751 type:complete len:388 (+) Transcript_32356:111-1274(+)